MNIPLDCPLWCSVLSIVFIIAWFIQIVLQIVIWHRPLRHLRAQRKQSDAMAEGPDGASASMKQGVSIVVYAHNQGEALVRNLPVLLSQDYPSYEVIVIDDTSRDETQDVLTMMDQRYEHLFHTRIDEKVRTMSHRKLAVLLGTKAAHYDLIVLTQAQCMPNSEKWLDQIAGHFQNPAIEVVLGAVVYERRSSFMSRFAQYDLFHRLVRMFGLTLVIKPFAGWGQNMAFRKSTFYANGSQGYQRHLNIQPGEDDLFVGDVANGSNVAVECRPESLMTDQTTPLFLGWSIDRLNRGFTSRLYAALPVSVKVTDDLTRYLSLLPGLGLMGYFAFVALTMPELSLFGWEVVGIVALLLVIRAVLLVYAEASFAKMLHVRPFITWPLFMDLYLPIVDVWYRVKALFKHKSFGVGYIGLK